MYTMLGIPNCDTVRKARKYLDQHQVRYRFRDIRKEPLSTAEWRVLVASDASGRLVNTRSPSFRKTGLKAVDLNHGKRVAVLTDTPTVMKRPVILRDNQVVAVGFSEASFAALLEDAS